MYDNIGWKYYNHAVIPTCAPDESPNMDPIETGKIWKLGGRGLFLARWTTDFDCDHKTRWWYCIKDNEFDIDKIKAKRRYEINKGKKNYIIKTVSNREYRERIGYIEFEAWKSYPSAYRPKKTVEDCIKGVENWDNVVIFAAFDRLDKEIHGYLTIEEHDTFALMIQQKVLEEDEKKGINAALVNGVLEYYSERLRMGKYMLVDGERNLVHQTRFQDYLEKYFGFRKAYCTLNIKYRKWVKTIVKIMYPFRRIVYRFPKGIFRKIGAILQMEEIVKIDKYEK